jgi:hypothetical protein
MTQRLIRIEVLIASITALLAVLALATGVGRPLGIAFGGSAAWLDFVLIRKLAAAALARRPPMSHVVSMAVLKSLVLLAVPAAGLLLPSSLIDGVSFAIGVTALPLAVVFDASLSVPTLRGV